MSNRERYDDARAYWNDWRNQATEDLRFSNPADPKQWDDRVIQARGRNRPALVFDQTNQYIGQVVNDARQMKPAINVVPGDNMANDASAKIYSGLIRQIEYASRAQIAYDTGVEYAARIGLGFVLVVPELVDGKFNDHDIRIKAVVDPLAATLDPDSIEPDGQDADVGWLETRLSERAFKRRWPKAKMPTAKGDRWADGNTVLVCQEFERTYKSENRIVTQDGRDFSEDDYHAEGVKAGKALPFHSNYSTDTPKVMWRWISGDETLEETEYPSRWIGLVPVYGNILWVDGKRQICGMTRRMMDGQRAYNYERSAYIEAVALSPKAPWIAPARAVAAYQTLWDSANQENRSVLPFDHVDKDGNPIPEPKRQDPPAIGNAFVQNAQQALQDIQASVGMYKANLGQNSNAKSGVAINRLQTEGDTSTFHYIDNLSRTIEQVGRICVDLIPTYYDRERVVQILDIDGSAKQVRINPEMEQAHAPGDVPQFNPNAGEYAVRVKAGPSFTTMRAELKDDITQMSNGNPQLGAALAPLLLRMSDMPEAEKVSKIAMALLPPPVQQAYQDADGPQPIPPQIKAAIDQLQQHNQMLTQALQNCDAELQKVKGEAASDFNDQLIKAYEAETGRIEALGGAMTPESVMALIQQVVQQSLATPSPSLTIGHPDAAPPGGMPIAQPTEPGPAPGSSFPAPGAMPGPMNSPPQGIPPQPAS
jgi:hypothetical protein